MGSLVQCPAGRIIGGIAAVTAIDGAAATTGFGPAATVALRAVIKAAATAAVAIPYFIRVPGTLTVRRRAIIIARWLAGCGIIDGAGYAIQRSAAAHALHRRAGSGPDLAGTGNRARGIIVVGNPYPYRAGPGTGPALDPGFGLKIARGIGAYDGAAA